jgi:hypothetical protein
VSEPTTWQAANDHYLTVALHWLRLRLAWHAGAHRARLALPAAAEAAEPEDPRPRLRPRARRWTGRAQPAAAAAAGPPPPALPAPAPEAVAEAEVAEAEAAMLAAERGDQQPALLRLAELLGLSVFERRVLLLCAAMELDPSMGARCAAAQGDPRSTYPTFALAMQALPDPAWEVLSPHRGLRWWRLVEINQPPGQPLVTSALRADERIVSYLKGLNYLDDRLDPLLEPLPVDRGPGLPPSQLAAVDEVLGGWSRQAPGPVLPLVQLLGADGHSKRLVAAAAAARAGLVLVRLPAESLLAQGADLETLARLWSRESVLLDGAVYVDAQELDGGHDGDGRARLGRFLARTSGVVLLGAREPWPGLDRPAFTVDVSRPTRSEQRAAWAAALGAAPGPAPDALAGQFNLDLPAIAEIAAIAPAGNGDEEATARRLWDACLASTRPRLDALAQRLAPKATWEDLVLPAAELALLHRIADQVAQRSTVYEDWGFGARTTRGLGINALFAGPSGTGKTMAAEVLAGELRLDLYRIDLSAVVSKYIGETEKNLRRLFDAAEEGGALLFFDEADALFGKRSEVKDSHDRYANIEVNYLLQRMEAYRGLAVLATNRRSALDTAFLRRLRFVVTFPFPGPVERRAIWEKVFPGRAPTAGLDVDRLARLPATGGMIHNIALNAAFAAAHAGSDVTMPLLLDAARSEFSKLELPVPDRDLVWTVPEPARP